MKRIVLIILITVLTPQISVGVEPDEILDNPILEQRAREISKNIRCMVCQNENIDASEAELARDFRILIREKLVEGNSDQEIYDYIVDRYGEFALLQPRFNTQNWILYFSGPILIVICLFIVWRRYKGKGNEETEFNELTLEEEHRIEMLRNKNRK